MKSINLYSWYMFLLPTLDLFLGLPQFLNFLFGIFIEEWNTVPVPWKIARVIIAAVLGLIIYLTIKNKKFSTNQKLWRLFVLIFLVPGPFFGCFDSCGPPLIYPAILAPLPVLFAFASFFSPKRVWLHGVFTIIFALIFIPTIEYIQKQSSWTALQKRIFIIVVYIGFWICISLVWSLIPLKSREMWVGLYR